METETGKVHGPHWYEALKDIAGKPGISGVEIGTFQGDSAEWMCQNIFSHDESVYFCIDPFTGNPDQIANGVDFSGVEAATRERLKKYPQCIINKGYSHDLICEWIANGEKVDFVYVDGSHFAGDVLFDSFLAFKLLKVGGVLCWDDYLWAVQPAKIDRPQFAIDTFLEVWGHKLTVLHKDWHVTIRKEKE